MKIFYAVDCQKDFINKDGRLSVPGAMDIKSNIERWCRFSKYSQSPLWASVDWHDLNDVEFNKFPPHCIKGTKGAELIDEVAKFNPTIIPKLTYDVFAEPFVGRLLDFHEVDEVVVFGVVTEICVAAAIEGFLQQNIKVSLATDAIMYLDKFKADAYIAAWEKKGVKTTIMGEKIYAEYDSLRQY